MVEEIDKDILDFASKEAYRRAKAFAWAKKVIKCIGDRKVEAWFLANYIYWLNRGRPFDVDQAHVLVDDEKVTISITRKIKPKDLKKDYLPYEILLVLQDIMNVQVEVIANDERVRKVAANTFYTIAKFPAKNGKLLATWNIKAEEPVELLKKSAKEIMDKIKKIANRKCFNDITNLEKEVKTVGRG